MTPGVQGYSWPMIRPATLALFFVFFLSALGFVFAFRQVNTLVTQEVMALSDEDFRRQHRLEQQSYTDVLSIKKLSEKLLGRSAEWKTYRNPYLGISFEYPDMAVLSSADCAAVYAPVQPATDNDNSRVFVALGHRFTDTCATETVTLRELQLHHALNSADVPWVIEVFPAVDDTVITSYITNRFGPGCSLSPRTETTHEGMFDYTIVGDGLALDKSQCPVNYAVAIKYSPEVAKAAVWILGQAPVFLADTSGSEAFDVKMAESFRWEE